MMKATAEQIIKRLVEDSIYYYEEREEIRNREGLNYSYTIANERYQYIINVIAQLGYRDEAQKIYEEHQNNAK